MKIVLLIIIVLTVIWSMNDKAEVATSSLDTPINTYENNVYECDGRQYCSQMTSCEEATFFIENCPNTKMDGNNDGVPCEKQWCY